jgi:hypothetical protein
METVYTDSMPGRTSGFRIHVKDEWRYCRLLRVVARGKKKGMVVVEVPCASAGRPWKAYTVSPAEILCTCCGTYLRDVTAHNVAGGGVMFKAAPPLAKLVRK